MAFEGKHRSADLAAPADYLTVDEISARYRIPIGTVRFWIRTGVIGQSEGLRRLGKLIRIYVPALEGNFINRKPRGEVPDESAAPVSSDVEGDSDGVAGTPCTNPNDQAFGPGTR